MFCAAKGDRLDDRAELRSSSTRVRSDMLYAVDAAPGGQATMSADIFPIMTKNEPTLREIRAWIETTERAMVANNWGWILNNTPSPYQVQHGEPIVMASQAVQVPVHGAPQADINSVLRWNVQIDEALRQERARVMGAQEYDIAHKNRLANQILASMAVNARTWRDKLMAECRYTGSISRPGSEHEYDGQRMLQLIRDRLTNREMSEHFDEVDHDEAISAALRIRLDDTCTSADYSALVNGLARDHKPYTKMIRFDAESWSDYIVKLLPQCCTQAGRALVKELKGSGRYEDANAVIAGCCGLIMDETRERMRRTTETQSRFQLNLAAQAGVAAQHPSLANLSAAANQATTTQVTAQSLASSSQAQQIAVLQAQLAALSKGQASRKARSQMLPGGKRCAAGSCRFDHDVSNPGSPCLRSALYAEKIPEWMLAPGKEASVARILSDRVTDAARLGIRAPQLTNVPQSVYDAFHASKGLVPGVTPGCLVGSEQSDWDRPVEQGELEGTPDGGEGALYCERECADGSMWTELDRNHYGPFTAESYPRGSPSGAMLADLDDGEEGTASPKGEEWGAGSRDDLPLWFGPELARAAMMVHPDEPTNGAPSGLGPLIVLSPQPFHLDPDPAHLTETEHADACSEVCRNNQDGLANIHSWISPQPFDSPNSPNPGVESGEEWGAAMEGQAADALDAARQWVERAEEERHAASRALQDAFKGAEKVWRRNAAGPVVDSRQAVDALEAGPVRIRLADDERRLAAGALQNALDWVEGVGRRKAAREREGRSLEDQRVSARVKLRRDSEAGLSDAPEAQKLALMLGREQESTAEEQGPTAEEGNESCEDCGRQPAHETYHGGLLCGQCAAYEEGLANTRTLTDGDADAPPPAPVVNPPSPALGTPPGDLPPVGGAQLDPLSAGGAAFAPITAFALAPPDPPA